MRTRVVLTNGKVSCELFWLSHHGKDIYWGFGGGSLRQKVSHHASGTRYFRTQARTIRSEPVSPPARVKGYEPILILGSLYDPSWYSSEQATPFSGSKLDAVFMVDTRSLPKRGQNQIHVGMIEAGRLDVLGNLVRNGTKTNEGKNTPRFRLLQSLLITNCSPWVILSLQTISMDHLEA